MRTISPSSSPLAALPRLECRRQKLGAVAADPGATWWLATPPIPLCETIHGGAPKQATWFKIAWDERELRVLFFANDDDAWATLTEHDAPLYDEEVVEIFLDPVGDLESYFEIEVNPLNAVCDLVLRRIPSGYRKNFAWHCDDLQTAVQHISVNGESANRHLSNGESANRKPAWIAELSIPFASLGSIEPRAGMRWRGNFYRIDRPQNSEWELSAWSPTFRPAFHVQERFGIIEFVD